jgi:hypothetical protein
MDKCLTLEKNETTQVVHKNIYPNWYKILEIHPDTYLNLMKPLYDILEGKKISKSEPDPFSKQGWISFNKTTEEEWEESHKKIQIARAFSMTWGDFHQNLMGTFPGWIDYKKGHDTGCDIGKEDNTCVAEIKNNVNTMNSSSKESVLRKLKKQKDLGKRALLIIINGDIAPSIKDGIEMISGKQFYEELSGRSTFMEDLLFTTTKTFERCNTLDSLKSALKNV